MHRDFEIVDADMGGMYHEPWPFFGNPPLREFHPFRLVADIVIALTLIVAAGYFINSRLVRYEWRFRFSVRLLLAITALAGVSVALLKPHWPSVTLTWDLVQILIGTGLCVVPNCGVVVAVFLLVLWLVTSTTAQWKAPIVDDVGQTRQYRLPRSWDTWGRRCSLSCLVFSLWAAIFAVFCHPDYSAFIASVVAPTAMGGFVLSKIVFWLPTMRHVPREEQRNKPDADAERETADGK